MKALMERQNPLYGRIDLTLNLKPMDYYDSALFYPEFSEEDKVRLFSVFGGISYEKEKPLPYVLPLHVCLTMVDDSKRAGEYHRAYRFIRGTPGK